MVDKKYVLTTQVKHVVPDVEHVRHVPEHTVHFEVPPFFFFNFKIILNY